MHGRSWGNLFPVLGITGAVLFGLGGCQGQVSYSILSDRAQAARGNSQSIGLMARGSTEGDPGYLMPVAHQASAKPAPNPERGPEHVALAQAALQACESTGGPAPALESGGVPTPLPRELWKESLPPYIIEPPDTLVIEAIRIVPLPPYRIEPLDVLQLQVADTLPNQPISGNYAVGPDGALSLGYAYGALRVSGMTLEQAAAAIKSQLSRVLKAPQVGVALAQFRGMQQVRGEHLVSMDGTINLGSYGFVYITGLTVPQAKAVVEKHLSKFLLNPEISLAVSGYNSKVYYVITDGAGFGEQVFRFPITGNETVLDALSNINGVPPAGSKRHIWLARPSPPFKGCYQVLPVD